MEALYDRLENVAGARAFLGAGEDRRRCVEADDVLDLTLHSSGCALGRSILLMTGITSRLLSTAEIGVRQRLRFDAL